MSAAEVSAFWDEHFPQIQAGRDCSIVSISPGAALSQLKPDERHLRPGGTISGPALFTLADVAACAVLLAHIGPEPLIVTTNLTLNFLRRPPLAPLLGDCRILKPGKRLAVVEVGIRPEAGGDLLAHATGTYSVPPPAAVL
ncbi:MAG TPA: PaaI family thioesterase [Propylenella sp.]|nr:PaaI family thioesterase [Propylenella sp.]